MSMEEHQVGIAVVVPIAVPMMYLHLVCCPEGQSTMAATACLLLQ